MKRTRRKFSSEFKSQVAIEALKERYALTELAHKFELHPNQISQWKQEFLERGKSIFETENSRKHQGTEQKPNLRYQNAA